MKIYGLDFLAMNSADGFWLFKTDKVVRVYSSDYRQAIVSCLALFCAGQHTGAVQSSVARTNDYVKQWKIVIDLKSY